MGEGQPAHREMHSATPGVKAMATRGEKVTFSVGIAAYGGGDSTSAEMMKLADKSLYHAKHSGRDRAGALQWAKKQGR